MWYDYVPILTLVCKPCACQQGPQINHVEHWTMVGGSRRCPQKHISVILHLLARHVNCMDLGWENEICLGTAEKKYLLVAQEKLSNTSTGLQMLVSGYWRSLGWRCEVDASHATATLSISILRFPRGAIETASRRAWQFPVRAGVAKIGTSILMDSPG